MFLENEVLYGHSFELSGTTESIPFGQAKVLIEGMDVTIIAFSLQVKLALEAADVIKNDGISCEVFVPLNLLMLQQY